MLCRPRATSASAGLDRRGASGLLVDLDAEGVATAATDLSATGGGAVVEPFALDAPLDKDLPDRLHDALGAAIEDSGTARSLAHPGAADPATVRAYCGEIITASLRNPNATGQPHLDTSTTGGSR